MSQDVLRIWYTKWYTHELQYELNYMILNSFMKFLWRTDRDSNPGDGLPPTHFPGVRLRPLGHLSVDEKHTSLRARNASKKSKARASQGSKRQSKTIWTRRF